MRQVSKPRQKENRDYSALNKRFLALNPVCGVCIATDSIHPRPATELHHSRGRIKALLTDERFFIAACKPCHDWIHAHPNHARKIGMLATPAEWNTVPPQENLS